MPSIKFNELSLKGEPTDVGFQHGLALKSKIEQALHYYLALFNLKEAALFSAARRFQDTIADFDHRYCDEIEGIAKGAGVEAEYIYMLNARSEILNNLSVPECTTIYNQATGLLAQNWDWSQTLEPLMTVLRIDNGKGHRVTTITEPGIIGKLGMNNAGLAVSLNILKHREHLAGVPVHVMLRAVLDCQSLDEVRALLAKAGVGKASHILVADDKGGYLCAEFAGAQYQLLSTNHQGLLVHTNHYLCDEGLNSAEAFPSTRERFDRAWEVLAYDRSDQAIESILLDQSEGLASICRPYSLSALENFGPVGTVLSVMMKPNLGYMDIRPGDQAATPFYRIDV